MKDKVMKTSIVLTMIQNIMQAAIKHGMPEDKETDLMRDIIDVYAEAQEKEIAERNNT